MSTLALAQDVIICEICNNSPVQMHCNTCATNLCDSCVSKHISADTEKDHHVAIFKKKNTTPIFPRCEIHKDQKCEIKCRQCNIPICVKCLTSGSHENHNFIDLLQLCNSHRNTIKQQTTELETSVYPKIENVISELETRIECFPQIHKTLLSQIDKQGKDWHREVDVIISKRKQEAEKMKTDYLASLKQLLEEMKSLLFALRQDIMENNDIVQSADVIRVLESKSTSPEMWNPPPSVDVTPPTFTPLPLQREQLHLMFGTFATASVKQVAFSSNTKDVSKKNKKSTPHFKKHGTRENKPKFTIEVRGMSKTTTIESIYQYFEDTKNSGGGVILDVEGRVEDGVVYVTFESEEACDRVCKREHEVDSQNLQVSIHHSFLGQHVFPDKKPTFSALEPVTVQDLDWRGLQFIWASQYFNKTLCTDIERLHGKICWPLTKAQTSLKVECMLNRDDQDYRKIAKTWAKDVTSCIHETFNSLALVSIPVSPVAWNDVLFKLQKINVPDPELAGIVLERKTWTIHIVGAEEGLLDLMKQIEKIIQSVS